MTPHYLLALDVPRTRRLRPAEDGAEVAAASIGVDPGNAALFGVLDQEADATAS